MKKINNKIKLRFKEKRTADWIGGGGGGPLQIGPFIGDFVLNIKLKVFENKDLGKISSLFKISLIAIVSDENRTICIVFILFLLLLSKIKSTK